MNYTFDLPGLREDMARDFLAAMGLLRLLDLKWPKLRPKLSWSNEIGCPRMSFVEELPPDWCHLLVSDIQSLESHSCSPLFHGDIIKTDYQVFRDSVLQAVAFGKTDHPFAALPECMFSAYSGQIPDPKTGLVEATMLSFANGQGGKSLLRDARELIRALDADEMYAALSGLGNPISAKSFRWTPQEYRPAAHRAHDPGSKVKGDEALNYLSFNVLAFIGLSCVPTCNLGEDALTAAFCRDAQGWTFQWPIWSHPLCIDEVIGLLHAAPSLLSSLPDVSCIWKSRRLVAEKSVYFAPATLA